MNSLRSAWTPVLASQNASIIGPRERFEDSPLARTSFASYPTIRLVQIIGQATWPYILLTSRVTQVSRMMRDSVIARRVRYATS